MPLSGYGIEFVRAAKKYNVDWRLIAAIGVRESRAESIWWTTTRSDGSAKIKFDDFSEAIDVVTAISGALTHHVKMVQRHRHERKIMALQRFGNGQLSGWGYEYNEHVLNKKDP